MRLKGKYIFDPIDYKRSYNYVFTGIILYNYRFTKFKTMYYICA